MTRGEWTLRPYGAFSIYGESALLAVDEKGGWLYFTAAKESAIERQAYRVRIEGGDPNGSAGGGDHRPSFRADGRFYVDLYSNISYPPALSPCESRREARWPFSHAPGSRSSPAPLHRPQAPRPACSSPSFFQVRARDGFTSPGTDKHARRL